MKYRCVHCGHTFDSTTVLHDCNGWLRELRGHIHYTCDHEVNFCNGDCLVRKK